MNGSRSRRAGQIRRRGKPAALACDTCCEIPFAPEILAVAEGFTNALHQAIDDHGSWKSLSKNSLTKVVTDQIWINWIKERKF